METGSRRLRRQPRIPAKLAMSGLLEKAPPLRGFGRPILPWRPERSDFRANLRANRASVSGRVFRMSRFPGAMPQDVETTLNSPTASTRFYVLICLPAAARGFHGTVA
jgi:hypothetical protein